MPTLSVGDLYHPDRRQWPEGADDNYRAGQHELRLFWPAPSDAEIQGVRRGRADFALLVEDGVIWLLYRFDGACGWSDAPYSWHLVPERERVLPPEEPSPESRALLTVILVDAATGVVKALRAVTFSPAFTAAVHGAIRTQAVRLWDPAAYDAALARAYARYPTTAAMLQAAQYRTQGGD